MSAVELLNAGKASQSLKFFEQLAIRYSRSSIPRFIAASHTTLLAALQMLSVASLKPSTCRMPSARWSTAARTIRSF